MVRECRILKREGLVDLFSLGELYVSDFIAPWLEPRAGKAELKMTFNETTSAVRLDKPVDPALMYGKYWYRSGTNSTMTNELEGIVKSINSVFNVDPYDMWIDIASNDGTLLSFVDPYVYKIGIDPVDNSFKIEAEKHANLIIQDFFSADVFKKSEFGDRKAKVITTIAMFYDLEDPAKFLHDIDEVLDDNGLFVVQMSYTPLMIEQLAFDNICHEHLYYYTLATITKLFSKNGFKILDCQLNDINGGSFRIYAMKSRGDHTKFGTQPYRDVCNFRVKSILSHEAREEYNTVGVWQKFYKDLLTLKEKTVNFITEEKAKGKTVWGYGASTKGNTLLQYFGLDNTLIDGIAERSEYKFGLKTIGTNIPIYSEAEMRKANPDYLLILPWHFINEFIQREKSYLDAGGKFIVPCPRFEVIGGSS